MAKISESQKLDLIGPEDVSDEDSSVTVEDVDPNDRINNETKRFKYGIIYLSYIPEGLTIKLLREIMGEFGEVGRIYLQPERNNKKRRTYTEGWIEFKKKRVAKSAAKMLNGMPLRIGKKHCKLNGQIWSIKYLHRFKWTHLKEQLAHDIAVRDQKRSFEIRQTKKQVDFYQKMTEKSRLFKKLRAKKAGDPGDEATEAFDRTKNLASKQKQPVVEGNELAVHINEDLLSNIFKKVS